MSNFLIVKPFDIDNTAFISSNVPENDYSEWNSGTTYALGDRVIIIDDNDSPPNGVHKIYESLVGSNTGNNPLDDIQAPAGVPTYWIEVSATNRWKMFDQLNSSQTIYPSTIEVELYISRRPNSVAVLNVEAKTIQVIMYDTGVSPDEVFNQTFNMIEPSGEPSYYNWFFQQIQKKTDLYVSGLPPIAGGSIKIIIDNEDQDVKCGTCLVGFAETYGETSVGAEVGIVDFSVKRQNEFGDFEILERAYSREGRFSVLVPNDIVDKMQTLLASRRAIPTLYIGSELFESTLIYGFYVDMNNVIQYQNQSLFSIEVVGLT
jgi:hypothetical protein